MSGIQISKADIEECQEIVNNFRVNELHLLLTSYHYPKLGKKQDLVQRAKSILSNPKYQLSAVQKVREIQAGNRIRGVLPPYPTCNSSNNSSSAQNDLTMRRQQQFLNHNQNTINRNATLLQATNCFGQNFNNTSQPNNSNFSMSLNHHFSQNNHSSNNSSNLLFNFGYAGAGGNGNSNVSSLGNGNTKNLKIISLPFYDVKSIIVPLTELPSFSIQPRPGESRHQCLFGVSPEDSAKLFYKSEDKPLPRYEIQLRMFQLDTTSEQQDAFPPGCVVKLDDYNVTLPNVIPTNKPNAEHKRLSRPVNLTPYCQPPRPRDRPHRMIIEWNGDKRAWVFAIYLVYRLNASILQTRIMQNSIARRSFEATKCIIIKRLNGDDDDGIEMDSLKISLLCPLTRTRIKTPARAIDCTHLQFFDLSNYLMMCEKRPVWKCPICVNQAFYSKLIIDQYFQKIITTTAYSVEEVELLKDGSWRIIKEEIMDLSDDDDVVVASSSKANKKTPAVLNQIKSEIPSSTSNLLLHKDENEEIIILSDSDDDNNNPGQVSTSFTNLPVSTAQNTTAISSINRTNDINTLSNNHSTNGDNNDNVIDSQKKQNANSISNKAKKNLQEQQKITKKNSNQDADSSDSIICLDSDDEDNKFSSATNKVGGNNNEIDNQNINYGNDQKSAEGKSWKKINYQSQSDVVSNRTAFYNQKQNSPNLSNENLSTIISTNNIVTSQTSLNSNSINNFNNNLGLTLQQNLCYNGISTLQKNSFHPPVFRPVIDELAKTHVAQELATFLQNVCAKNSIPINGANSNENLGAITNAT